MLKRRWVQKRCIGIRANLKEDSKFKSQTCTNPKIRSSNMSNDEVV